MPARDRPAPDLRSWWTGDGTCVCIGARREVLDHAALVEAVAGRLGDGAVDSSLRSALDVRA